MGAATILVVDDEADFRATLRRALEREGYAVRESAGGAEAMRRLQVEPCDLMILDLSMPGMTGLEFLEALRAAGRVAPPAIVLTAFGDWGSYARAVELGVVAFLSKPIGTGELLHEVARALAARPCAGGPAAPRKFGAERDSGPGRT